MSSFHDGPAVGKRLHLRRAPYFLRVAIEGNAVDALDQIDDVPKPGEALFVYFLQGDAVPQFISRRTTRGNVNARPSGRFEVGNYRLYFRQPPSAVLRDRERWQQWAIAESEAVK